MAKLFTYKFFIVSFAITAVYIIFTIYLMNFHLVRDTIVGNYPLSYKGELLFELLGGMWTSMTSMGLILLVISALLTGANLTLFVSRIKQLRTQGKIRLAIGGSSLLGIVGSGCTSCGLPVIALLGLGGSVALLPLRGAEISYVSILMLLISFYFLVKTGMQQSCQIERVTMKVNMKKSYIY